MYLLITGISLKRSLTLSIISACSVHTYWTCILVWYILSRSYHKESFHFSFLEIISCHFPAGFIQTHWPPRLEWSQHVKEEARAQLSALGIWDCNVVTEWFRQSWEWRLAELQGDTGSWQGLQKARQMFACPRCLGSFVFIRPLQKLKGEKNGPFPSNSLPLLNVKCHSLEFLFNS